MPDALNGRFGFIGLVRGAYHGATKTSQHTNSKLSAAKFQVSEALQEWIEFRFSFG